MKKTYKTAHLFGIDFFGNSKDHLLKELASLTVNSSKTSYIVTPNPEQIIQSRGDDDFLECLQRADFALPDGVGILLAAKIQRYKDAKRQKKGSLHYGPSYSAGKRDDNAKRGTYIEERISGREVVVDLLGMAQEKGLKVLVVGGRGLAQVESQKFKVERVGLKRKGFLDGVYPVQGYGARNDTTKRITYNAKRINWLEGYRDVQNPTKQEEQEVVQTIKELRPDIVFVAFGAPAQEKWMFSHSSLLEESKVKIVMAVGGSFDYILGKVPQTPDWIARAGFEWLFRLVTQPWRWRRQLRLVQFVWLVLTQRARES